MMTASSQSRRKLLQVLDGTPFKEPPVWMMRQAGRYLPEYKQTRAIAGSFLDLCYTPDLAVEVTLQPIRRFGFDASILFSDILVVPHALGQKVWFVEGEGPRLEALSSREAFESLRSPDDPGFLAHLAPVLETVGRLREELPAETTLLGFCGGPWTVASYMIGGRGTPDLAPARALVRQDPALVRMLIERLVDVQSSYLIEQLRAGADAVQIFESHAGVLPDGDNSLAEWCFRPVAEMIRRIRAAVPGAKIIVFARGSGLNGHLQVVSETGANAVGVDWGVDLAELRSKMAVDEVTQGNLHPEILVAGGDELDRAVDAILAATEGKPHIFNLGHGITPQTPIAHVEQMLSRIRRQ